MKERPILMSAPMVLAILDGRKTMTRRVAKQQPGPTTFGYTELLPGHFKPVRSLREFVGDIGSEDHKKALDEFWADENNETLICPYGQPGDRLWVRETWFNPDHEAYHWACPVCKTTYYKATDDPEEWPWKSPIFMPRWASRILMERTEDARVERLEDITEEDAKREGFGSRVEFLEYFYKLMPKMRGLNPWVWAIAFKRLP